MEELNDVHLKARIQQLDSIIKKLPEAANPLYLVDFEDLVCTLWRTFCPTNQRTVYLPSFNELLCIGQRYVDSLRL